MKLKILVAFFLGFFFARSQNYELKNEKLTRYFSLINSAELKITEDKLDSANILYRSAFKTFKHKFAKDMYNSFLVSLKLKDWKNAFAQYKELRCMEYGFKNINLPEEFKKYISKRKISCKQTINRTYSNSLDSLFVIDQKYRELSGGNYSKYEKEITEGDSITSLNLLKMIQEKGFPNEYDLGLKSSDERFFHSFYYIIRKQSVFSTESKLYGRNYESAEPRKNFT